MSNDTEVGDFETLLRDFRRQVPERPERLPTFQEISGYPHYENVCSNILAFYLDPGKPHGLGTLFLDSLGKVGKIEDLGGSMGSEVEVETQEKTANENYIDILIRSASHAVLIENKIFHAPNNPFCDYAIHLDSLEQPHKHKFLLTLNSVEESTAQECGFENITHEQVVKEIRVRLGAHVAGADTRYLTFMLDFLNTLDHLKKGTVMDPEFFEFVESHQPDIESLLCRVKEFKTELGGKITQLEQMIDLPSHLEAKQWTYGKKLADRMWVSLVHDIAFAEDFEIGIETTVMANGWKIHIYTEPDGAKTARLAALLEKLEIPLSTCFDYAANLKDIADLLQDVVSKLADARSSGNH